ncbi:MAG: hypothetical protein KC649_03840 [Candidatus Omnitrophica bacterium]|nr:hypothetical protein [Candidatus Omnitrophota bacterium]
MKQFQKSPCIFRLFACIVFVSLFSVNRAYAYIDPGSGSYLFQLLIAGIMGSLFAVKTFWHKITAFFKKFFCKPKK